MKHLYAIIYFLLVFSTNNIFAAPITSRVSGNWNSSATWVGGVVPVVGDAVVIANGHTVTVDVNAFCASVIIGNGPRNSTSTLTMDNGIVLTVSGNINIRQPLHGTNNNILNVNAGTVYCLSLITANSSNNSRKCIVNISTGMLSCTANFAFASNINRNKLVFSGSGILQIAGTASTLLNAQFTAATGTINYNAAGNQNILPLDYYTLACSVGGIKSLSSNTVVTGDLQINNNAQLDVTVANNYSLDVGGNWLVTSTNANPFIENKGTVTFNGTAATQILSTRLPGETFYTLIVDNTAANPTDIKFNSNCMVTQEYDQYNGILDLNGKSLTVNSSNNTGAFITCSLTGGWIISTTAAAQISFSDANDSTYVKFSGTNVGSTIYPVSLTINTGRINIEYLTLYGAGNFTKTFPIDDAVAIGGNKYHGDVSFTATSTASSWRMSTGNAALPDSFFAKAVFNAKANAGANNNFIIGANSVGNYYADSVTLTSTTSGGLFIGCQNGAVSGTSSSHYFKGHVVAMVSNSGNISFADGTNTLPSTVVFNKTLQLNSTITSTGDIYVGNNTTGSSISFVNTANVTDGAIRGATKIYFYNVIQTGFYLQFTTNSGSSNSTIVIGSASSPCVWNGSVAFSAPNIDIANSTFNGFFNVFVMNGNAANQNCTGGNTFAFNTNNIFTNSGTKNWYLANTTADTYNGNVYFTQASTGLLRPSYNTNCTYAGNISIQSGSDSIAFAAGANGRVTINGNSATSFNNSTVKGTTIKRLTINKTSGNFTLNKGVNIPTGGDMSLLSGKIVTTTAHILRMMDETCTVTATNAASTSYVNGPMQYDVTNIGAKSLHFPIGKASSCRPVQLAINHSTGTSYSYVAEVFNASANVLGWTLPFPINNVSTAHYWDVKRYNTSTGAVASAVNLSGNQTITLHYGADDNITDTAVVRICKNTMAAPTAWSNIGAIGASITTGSVSSTSSPDVFNSFSRFTLAYAGAPQPPTGSDSSRCGTGSVMLKATAVNGEQVDWYDMPTGGTLLLSDDSVFNTPSISNTTVYYAESRNVHGVVSATRTAVTATIYHTASISSFTPVNGYAGSIVVISGTNFNTVTGVSFGGTPATSYSINSDTQITATVAATVSGAVALTNSCGKDSLGGFGYLYVTTWTGVNDNTWMNALNWDNGVPNNLFSTIITNVSNVPLIVSNQAVKSLTIQPGAFLNIAVSNTLSVIDSISVNGTIIGAGSISLVGTASQPISGNGTISNMVLNNSSGAVISNAPGTLVNVTGRITPATGIFYSNENLVLKSDGGGTASIGIGNTAGGYINGKITMERFVPARRAWRLIAFPVTAVGAPTINEALQENAGGNTSYNPSPGYGLHITGGSVANGFDQNPLNNASMKELSGSSLLNISTTNQPISNSNAYFLFVRGSRANNLALLANAPADNVTLRIHGNVKQGNQSIPISGRGWKLIGNPFASRINLDNIAVNNSTLINRNFNFWDPKLGGSNNVGGYVTASYNGSTYDFTPTPISSLSEYAQPFAAVYVDAIAAGNLTINENNKCSCGNDNVFRPTGVQTKIRINLHSYNSDATIPLVDGVMAVFDDKYTSKKDKQDAEKLENPGAENLSIQSSDHPLSIDRRKNIVTADTILLHISNVIKRTYQLELKPENFSMPGLSVFIEDKFLQTVTPINLTAGTSIDFTITDDTASASCARFRIIFKIVSLNVSLKISNTKAITQKNASAGNAVNIYFDWKADNQLNVAAYEIERAVDERNFSTIGIIVGKENTSTANYSFTDSKPATGVNYYRIKATEKNGDINYSAIVKAIFTNENSIRLVKNPVTNNIILLEMNGQQKGVYPVAMFDAKGVQFMTTSINHDGTDGTKSIAINKYLPKGIYHLTIKYLQNKIKTFKISIE